jgi:hypothetical protein
MTSAIAKMLALAAVIGLSFAAPARAQTASSEAFSTACNANPGFFSFAVTGLDSDPEGLGRLCSCLATEFSGFSDDDYTMLIKDLERTATDADRAAYGDYTGLELKAREALDKCLVLEGFADGSDPGAATPAAGGADMTEFDAACHGSDMLLTVIGGSPEDATPVRTSLCDCLSIALAPQVSTEGADILGQDLDGTATEASRTAYPGYPELESRAGAAFDSCFATAMPQQ